MNRDRKRNTTKLDSSRKKSISPPSFSNHEIVTLAVYLLGGRSDHVDTEDVAIKSNAIAPGRFTWRKYRRQVNLELIRVYLSDAKKKEKGAYLSGSGSEGWLLTEAGFRFCRRERKKLKAVISARPVMGSKEKRWRRSEKARLMASTTLAKFRDHGPDGVTNEEACAFFRIDDYVTGKVREDKLVRVLNSFGADQEIGEAVRVFARKVRNTG